MRIEDRRRNDKSIAFKDLEVGSVFEHVNLSMIMIKLDDVSMIDPDDSYTKSAFRNALCIYDYDADAIPGRSSTGLWHISPESKVIPVNAKLVIEE